MAQPSGKSISFQARPRQDAGSSDCIAPPLPQSPPFDAAALKDANILGQKITEARKTQKISQRTLSAALESYNIFVSSGAISKWEKGDAMPNPYQLFALCHILKIEDILSFFTGGLPEPLDYTPELNQTGLNLLQMFKETLIASGNYQPRSRRTNAEPPEDILVKVFTTPAAAGSGSFLDGEDYEMVSCSPASVPEDYDFGIRITGDSMLPRYVPGEIVFVQQCSELYPGEIGVFVYNGSAYIKKYTETAPDNEELHDYLTSDGYLRPKVRLVSLNRERADCDVEVGPEDTLFIVGRVIS